MLLALPVSAQSVQSDLNGDGRVELFTLIETGEGTVDLQIENTGGGVVYASDIAWKGGIGQEPELDVAANGSVLLRSMNNSIGRNRWEQTLTIAFRDGVYRVAGFTFSWYDTLSADDNGTCDLNLLTRRGYLTVNEDRRDVRTKQTAVRVTAWTDVTPIPAACGFPR
jgi:hypothetical protein